MTRRPEETHKPARSERAEFLDSLWKGALIGALVLAVAFPVMRWRQKQHAPQQPPVAVAPQAAPQPTPQAVPKAPVAHAQFGEHEPSDDARRMANWVLQSGDTQGGSYVIVDKKDARVYVFDGKGQLKADTPALLGEAAGDDPVPGIGDKPLKEIKFEEKTTPAGRFVAEMGENAHHEDVVWVSYDLAVSMHRVLKTENRPARLASPTIADNRISFGCINLPPQFFENVLRPTVQAGRTVIYVLPETRPLQAQFANYREPDLLVAGGAGVVAQR